MPYSSYKIHSTFLLYNNDNNNNNVNNNNDNNNNNNNNDSNNNNKSVGSCKNSKWGNFAIIISIEARNKIVLLLPSM